MVSAEKNLLQEEMEKEDAFFLAGHQQEISKVEYDRGVWYNLKTSLKENKLAMICLILLGVIMIASLLAPLSSYDPDAMDLRSKLQLPSKEHFFGTDSLGRDYFTRALYGGRVSLTVGFFSMLVSIIVGTLFGTISGYIGGVTDNLMMRFVDILMSVPSFLLIIIINSFLSPSIFTMIIIIGIFFMDGGCKNCSCRNYVIERKRFCACRKESWCGKFGNHIFSYHSEYGSINYCGSKYQYCAGNLNGIFFKLFRLWGEITNVILGKHASKRAGTYHGCSYTCVIPGCVDITYSIKFQCIGRCTEKCTRAKDG